MKLPSGQNLIQHSATKGEIMDLAKERIASNWADRSRGAIWGQFAGDAACLGTHWIYNLDEIARDFPQGIAGFETPAPGHYHAGKRSGDFTHYGDAALLMLQSLAELGHFSAQDFGTRFVALFSSKEYHGYLDHATKGTLENCRVFAEAHPGSAYSFQGGADDDQPATATRLAPVVVTHCRDASLLKVAESATRVCQNNPRAVMYMRCHALIIREILAGRALGDAFKAAAAAVAGENEFGKELSAATEAVFSMQNMEVREATLKFGQVCPLKSSFPAAMHCALKHQSDFSHAILATASAGGDNAGRAAMIGTWLGALHGMQAIPDQWRAKVNAREEIDRCIDEIVARLGIAMKRHQELH
jgi:ADP-ribosyl-[dinitrogen reductase] hydrolase